MLTNGFFIQLAAALKAAGRHGGFFIAVGAGDDAWDQGGVREERHAVRLVAEVARKAVLPADIRLLDAAGQPTTGEGARVQFAVTFGGGEAIGLRECGLFGGSILLSYFIHKRVDKTVGMTLSRTVRIDLAPRAIAPGSRVTRYLANTSTTEFHDRDRATPLCQIEEIRSDRRYYFASVNEAVAAGYDYCAHCFDRERSRR